MSTSSNESFVVLSKESQDDEGNRVTQLFKPLVTFERVLDVYPLELDLIVRVTYDDTHEEEPDDKIVLVPVSWENIDEAFCVGEKINNVVRFPTSKLPRDETLCQFCYYTDQGRSILGLSRPFTLQHFSTERLVEFVDQQEYAILLNMASEGMVRLNVDENDGETHQKGEPGISEIDNHLIHQVTTEVIKNINKTWTTEKESLLTEMKELKESVTELEKKVTSKPVESDSDSSSDDESTINIGHRDNKPIIYGITPTYARPEQKALLTRLTHTLKLIPSFHWIVVEDAETRSPLVTDILLKSGLSFTHLVAVSPKAEKKYPDDGEYVVQRNTALRWLRQNEEAIGIVYFMDEYKIYSLEIFDEMRSIQRVGVWPVGLAGGLLAEKPKVDTSSGRVIGWNSRYRTDRLFPIDAIGCAINLRLLLARPSAMFSLEVEPALRLSSFLSKLVAVNDLEPKANNCTEVLVWHIRIEPAYVG